MGQLITPAIRCNSSADEATRFYADVFREGFVVEQVSGYATTVSIHGFQLSLISGGDQDVPNPSISCILSFNPLLFGDEEQARTYLSELYEHLSADGVLTELGECPFSPRYTWVRGRFGMTWQLMLTGPASEPHPFILPSSMFDDINHANAEEVTETWIALFDDAHRGTLRRCGGGEPIETGAVVFTGFTLRGTQMVAIDSGVFHDFTFTPGVSAIVSCRDRVGVGRYWAGLSVVPEAEHCGWYIDRQGVSQQVVPHNIAKLVANTTTHEKLLRMSKIDLVGL